MLSRKLRLSPLKFIRGDLTTKKQKRAFLLPVGMMFFDRFRLRIIFQNTGNYMVLLLGILFANLLLMFGLLVPSALDHYREYIATVVDKEDLTKLSRQLDVSMGGMMKMINVFAVVMFMILIYLLSKTIIKKNARSISLAKILGYTNGEISRLYIAATSIVVMLLWVLSLPVTTEIMEYIFLHVMLSKMSGWITFYVDPVIYGQMFLMGIGTYAVVLILEYRRVCRVKMDAALKNVE